MTADQPVPEQPTPILADRDKRVGSNPSGTVLYWCALMLCGLAAVNLAVAVVSHAFGGSLP